MNIKQLLPEIKNLGVYSTDEWKEYTSHFINGEEIIEKHLQKVGKRPEACTIAERIRSGKGAYAKHIDCIVSNKVVDEVYISDLRSRNKTTLNKMTLGVVSGSYDLLHLGHLAGFAYAKQFLAVHNNPALCALVLSDKSIRDKKGESRPILNLNERIEMLRYVRCIDYIIPLAEPNCLTALAILEPNYFFKDAADTSQGIVEQEKKLVDLRGGSVITFPDSSVKYISTTKLIEMVLAKT